MPPFGPWPEGRSWYLLLLLWSSIRSSGEYTCLGISLGKGGGSLAGRRGVLRGLGGGRTRTGNGGFGWRAAALLSFDRELIDRCSQISTQLLSMLTSCTRVSWYTTYFLLLSTYESYYYYYYSSSTLVCILLSMTLANSTVLILADTYSRVGCYAHAT